METAADRKRRLRRERILQNSDTRLKRILGDPRGEVDAADSMRNGFDSDVDPYPLVTDADPSLDGQPPQDVEPEVDSSLNGVTKAESPNGLLYPYSCLVGDEIVDAAPTLNDAPLNRGSFGFDASRLAGRERPVVSVDDTPSASSEWREAGKLLRSSQSEPPTKASSPTSGSSASQIPRSITRDDTISQRPNKRSKQAAQLRKELEMIMQQENSGQGKPQPRSTSAIRRKPPSLWYTKTWFRVSLTILLALFVRVLMQINLSDHFSDSAFYPFFSMELSFFVAAFCSKPPGYRIPMGGRVAEFIASLAGSSRELLGNLKWTFEFAFRKPLDEFFLYFFVFVVAHLLLIHVQDEGLHGHDEL